MAGRDKPASKPVYEMCPCCGRKLAGDRETNNYCIIGGVIGHESIPSISRGECKSRFTRNNKLGERIRFCQWCWGLHDPKTGKIYRHGVDIQLPIKQRVISIKEARDVVVCRKYMEEQDRLWREGKL